MQSIDRQSSTTVESGSELDVQDASLVLAEDHSVPQLQLFWDHRRSIARAALIGLIASALIAFLIPNRYESTAKLMPPDNPPSAMAALLAGAGGGSAGSANGLNGLLGDLVGGKTTSATFVGILQSRTVADQVIKQFNLQKVYRIRHLEDTRKELARFTDITVDRKSSIISVAVTDKDPQRATDMAQAYVQELDRLVALLSTSAARSQREFLENRLQVVKRELEQSEIELSKFSSKNSTLDLKEQAKAMMEAATSVQAQLIATQTELEGLRQIYSDSNVRVRTAQAQVNELKKKLNELGGSGAEAAPYTPSSSDFSYPAIRQLPVLGVTYADLYRKSKIAEVVFELLTKQYEMAKVEEAKEIPSVKVLDVPVVPRKKSFPPRLIIIVLGTLFAMVMQGTWVFTRRAWDLTEDHDPRKMLASDVLASGRRILRRVTTRVARFRQQRAGANHVEE